jgi:hypothetical protein
MYRLVPAGARRCKECGGEAFVANIASKAPKLLEKFCAIFRLRWLTKQPGKG